jgi:hypothetical protein
MDRRASSCVAQAMNYDFVVRRGVKDYIGVRMYDEAAKAACVGELAGARMQGDEVDNRLDPGFDVTGALRGVLIDMRQDVNEFFCGAKRVS